jgi:hypothetical protein
MVLVDSPVVQRPVPGCSTDHTVAPPFR